MFEDEQKPGGHTGLIPVILLIVVIVLLMVDPAPAATLILR